MLQTALDAHKALVAQREALAAQVQAQQEALAAQQAQAQQEALAVQLAQVQQEALSVQQAQANKEALAAQLAQSKLETLATQLSRTQQGTLATQPDENQTSESVVTNMNHDVGIIVRKLRSWTEAWTDRNPDLFLSYYSDNFVPTDNRSRSEWVSWRTQNILSKKYIKITASDIVVYIINNTWARVKFTQDYESNNYQDRVLKQLEFKFEDGQWLITKEEA